MYNQKELNHTYLKFQKAPEIELYSCLMSIKLASLEATLVQNYQWLTYSQGWGVELLA